MDSKRIPITASERKEGPYPYYGANGVQDYVADYIFDDELVLLAEDGGNFGSKDKPIAYRVSGKCWVNNHAHVLKPKPGINVDYLCYSLMFYNTNGLVNGATRQKLTQATMRKMQIPYRSEKEQKQIVDLLGKATAIINDKEYQAFKFNKSSRFYVVYGMNVENGEKDFYVYDSKNNTFSLYDTEYIDYLKEVNMEYKAKRESHRIKHPLTHILEEESFRKFKERCVAQGARDAQFKMNRLMQDETRHAMFKELVKK